MPSYRLDVCQKNNVTKIIRLDMHYLCNERMSNWNKNKLQKKTTAPVGEFNPCPNVKQPVYHAQLRFLYRIFYLREQDYQSAQASWPGWEGQNQSVTDEVCACAVHK